MRSRRENEHDEQVALFRWARLMPAPELRLLFAIPNGGLRHIAVARRLRAEGVRAGVPDICLPVARGGYHGLWIELKTSTGAVSAAQRQWLDALQREGYCAVVCRGWDEAREAIERYLGMPTASIRPSRATRAPRGALRRPKCGIPQDQASGAILARPGGSGAPARRWERLLSRVSRGMATVTDAGAVRRHLELPDIASRIAQTGGDMRLAGQIMAKIRRK